MLLWESTGHTWSYDKRNTSRDTEMTSFGAFAYKLSYFHRKRLNDYGIQKLRVEPTD